MLKQRRHKTVYEFSVMTSLILKWPLTYMTTTGGIWQIITTKSALVQSMHAEVKPSVVRNAQHTSIDCMHLETFDTNLLLFSASIIPWRIFNIRGTFPLDKMFFRLFKCASHRKKKGYFKNFSLKIKNGSSMESMWGKNTFGPFIFKSVRMKTSMFNIFILQAN